MTIDEQLPVYRSCGGLGDSRLMYRDGLLRKYESEAKMLILLNSFRDAKPVAKDENGAIYFEVQDGTIVASKLNNSVAVYKIDNAKHPYFHNIDLGCLRLVEQQQIHRFENDTLKPGEEIDGLLGIYLV